MITEEPKPPKSLSSVWDKQAYRDGWNAAANDTPRLPRPNYQTQQERAAYDLGWESRRMIGLL